MKAFKLVLVLLCVAAFGLQSCKKDPPRKQDDTSQCCSHFGTILPHYSGNDLIITEPLVIIDEFGNNFYVSEDATGKFRSLKKGDMICFDYEVIADCHYSTMPAPGVKYTPATCINLTCVQKRPNRERCESSHGDCGLIKELHYNHIMHKGNPAYTIKEGKIEGNTLKMKIAFGGCKDEDMVLELGLSPTLTALPTYECRLQYHKTMCKMLITKDICFDISEYPTNAVFNFLDAQGTKSFSR